MLAGEDTKAGRPLSAIGRRPRRRAWFSLALLSTLLSISPAFGYAPQGSSGQATVCSALSATGKNGQVQCRDQRTTFASGEDVCMLVRLKDPRQHRRYRAVAYRNGKEQRRYTSEEHPSWTAKGSDSWAHCEEHVALPGDWRFDLFVDRGRGGFERLSSAQFKVEADAHYRFSDAATCSFTGSSGSGGDVTCLGRTDRFLPGDPVHLWVRLADVAGDHRFMIKTYRDSKLLTRRHTHWRKGGKTPKTAYFAPTEYNSKPGSYRSEFFIDTGEGFKLVGERSFKVDVLSPVEGPLRKVCSWPSDPEVWAFCKHHRRHSRGLASADDTRAWDVNLARFADAGKPVYPVAPGRVVRYGGDVQPGGGPMAGVLIEHKTAGGELWWSGYLHMQRNSVTLKVGQKVDVDTPIGSIGKTGTSNSHLHVVVYDGENAINGLKSVDVVFRERDATNVVAKQSAFRR